MIESVTFKNTIMDGFAVQYAGNTILLATGCPVGLGKEKYFRFLEGKTSSFLNWEGVSLATLRQKSEWSNINLVAGASVLYGWDLIFDAEGKRITIGRDLFKDTENKAFPVDFNNGLLIVHAKINNQEVPLLLDTGSTHSFLSEAWFSKKTSLPEASGYLFGVGECSGPQSSEAMIIGNQSFQQHFVQIPDNLYQEWQSQGIQGILGINFFRNKKVGLSLLHQKLFIIKT